MAVTQFGLIRIAGGLYHHSRCASLGGAKVRTVTHFVPRRRQSDDSYTLWLDSNSQGVVPPLLPCLPRRRQSEDSYTLWLDPNSRGVVPPLLSCLPRRRHSKDSYTLWHLSQ